MLLFTVHTLWAWGSISEFYSLNCWPFCCFRSYFLFYVKMTVHTQFGSQKFIYICFDIIRLCSGIVAVVVVVVVVIYYLLCLFSLFARTKRGIVNSNHCLCLCLFLSLKIINKIAHDFPLCDNSAQQTKWCDFYCYCFFLFSFPFLSLVFFLLL